MDHTGIDLRAEQQATLARPRYEYSAVTRAMVRGMDAIAGAETTVFKARIVETLAPIPYRAWESREYGRLSRHYGDDALVREADAVLRWGREAQDTEYQHLRVIGAKLREDGERGPRRLSRPMPDLMAGSWALASRTLARASMRRSFLLNAEAEDHAEHYYAELVQAHPEWEEQPVTSDGRAGLRRVQLLGRRLPSHRARRARPPQRELRVRRHARVHRELRGHAGDAGAGAAGGERRDGGHARRANAGPARRVSQASTLDARRPVATRSARRIARVDPQSPPRPLPRTRSSRPACSRSSRSSASPRSRRRRLRPARYVNPSPAEIRAKLNAAAVARDIPPRILYGIAYQESTWRQFDANGDPLIGADGGIGIMQVTTIPAGVDVARLKTDIDYNIAVGADILVTKWGYAPSVFAVIGDGDPRCYEDWFFAVWAYNGLKADNPYPYRIWDHITDGRGLWTGLAVTPVPTTWLVDGLPPQDRAGRDAAARALVEPHAAAQTRAERAARAEAGRGRRPVHRLRHALAEAPGRRALGRAAPLALERLQLGAAPHGPHDEPRLRRRHPLGGLLRARQDRPLEDRRRRARRRRSRRHDLGAGVRHRCSARHGSVSEEHHLPRKKAKRSEDDFASYAWRLIGTFRTAAGWLDLTAGRLRFSTVDRGRVRRPARRGHGHRLAWYYFGGGVKLSCRRGAQYRFSFVLPNGRRVPDGAAGGRGRRSGRAGDRVAEGGRHRRRARRGQGVAAAARRCRAAAGPRRSPRPGRRRQTQRAARSSRSPAVRRSDLTCRWPVRTRPSRSIGRRKNPSMTSCRRSTHGSSSPRGITSSEEKVCSGVYSMPSSWSGAAGSAAGGSAPPAAAPGTRASTRRWSRAPRRRSAA